MAFLKERKIRCTNCGYEGPPELKSQGCLSMVIGGVLVIVGAYMAWSWVSAPEAVRVLQPDWETKVLMWAVLAVIGGIVGIVGLLSGEKWLCPKCKWQNPVRL